jgi:hypothetical protein
LRFARVDAVERIERVPERVEDFGSELARYFQHIVTYGKTRPVRLHRAFKSYAAS